MSWFTGEFPTENEMKLDLAAYLSVSHGTKKHVKLTKRLLRRFWVRSRRPPIADVWGELSALAHATPQGEIRGSSIKAAFRKRLLKLQDGRCCYCRRWLTSSAHGKPIEHVLPRSKYPQFAVEYWNLAVACSDCNGAKTDDVWGAIPLNGLEYPNHDQFSDMFHPRYHRFDDHLRYTRVESNKATVVWFAGITPQGYHLCKTLLYKIAAKESLVASNPILAKAMTQIKGFEEHASKEGLNAFADFQQALDESLIRLIS